jgi:membrane protein required for colicin V production
LGRAAEQCDNGLMNPFDIIVIVAIALSGLFAFARGFVKEALSVGAWIGSGLAALYAFPYARPIAAQVLPKGMVADLAAAVAVFIVVLIVLSLLTSAISRRVKASSLSALDRTLGLIFGLVRGVIVVCLAYIALNWALPPANQPRWVEEARTKKLLSTGADALRSLVPPALREKTDAAASQAQQRVEQAREAEGALRALQSPRPPAGAGQSAESGAEKGYGPDERRDLNRLFQQNTE